MQTTANRTVANSLPKNEVILLTLLISKRYIPYTDLRKISGISAELQQIKAKEWFSRRYSMKVKISVTVSFVAFCVDFFSGSLSF